MRGFDSRSRLHAGVAELEYAIDLRSIARKGLRVRLPPPAPNLTAKTLCAKLSAILKAYQELNRRNPQSRIVINCQVKPMA